MTAKLSIIVPVYNVEKYLAVCLDSLLNQTLRDIDIICVDDGSTDRSPKILKQYAKKDKRIRIITKKNGGLSSARNAGLAVVKTELVAFVDSDDILAPNTYELAVSRMTDDIDMVHFGIQTVDAKTQQMQKEDDDYYAIKFDGKTKITTDVMSSVDVSSCNKIFRKSIIDKYGICFPDGLRHEDAYFFNVYSINAKYCFYIQDKLYNYVRHEGSIMAGVFSNKPGHSIDHLSIAIKIYEYMITHGLFTQYCHYFGTIFFAYFDFAMRYEHTEIGKSAIYKMALEFLDKNHLSFAHFSDLIGMETMLRNRLWGINVKKSFFGLFKKKFKGQNIRYIFCGIPILRIKYCSDKIKYYPFALCCLYKRRVAATPLISVVMPVYNAEKYLREAIDSILNQTYTNFEFIVINDGSTDGSADIVRSYNDPRIVFVDNPKNAGLVAVLNQGLDMARGKYIARMDADDISMPERFKKQIEFMEKHRNVGVSGTFFHIFGDGIDRIETKTLYPKLKDMLATSPVGHPTVMMRRNVLNKYNLRYDPRYKHAEDYELWLRVRKYTKIANIPEVLLNYRWTGENVSAKNYHYQMQQSCVIKQKIRRAMGKTNVLTKCMIDSSELINVLGKLGTFSYMPNSGNMGDMLIASATMQWFDKNKLKYTRIKENETPETFVYGGGGAWTRDYIEYMGNVMNIMKNAKRVVILPSSFDNVPELVKILDKRFTVFCREQKSFDYLTQQNTGATILLDHDMALRMRKIPTLSCCKISSKMKKQVHKLKSTIKKLPSIVNMFRTDVESTGNHKTDFDLSDTLGWFSPYESRTTIDCAAHIMLKTMMRFNTVRTDRLHVGLAAMLVGADVEFYDNTYGKISGVYNNSLAEFGNITLIQDTEKKK